MALGATTCWSLVYGVGLVVPDEGVTVGANVLRNSFTAVATVAWFYVVVEYSRADWFERRSIVAALSVNPILLLVLGATNEYHHLVWARGTTITAAGVLEPEFGAYFYVHAVVTYGLLLASAVLLVRTFRSSRGVYRKQTATLLAGMAFPWLGSILFVTGTVPVEHLDTGPIGVAIGGTVFLLALFHYEFLEVAPVARETLMENMGDAVVAIDTKGRIIDINRRAREVFDVEGDAVARPIETVFPEYHRLVSQDGSGRAADRRRADGAVGGSDRGSNPAGPNADGGAPTEIGEAAPIETGEAATTETDGDEPTGREGSRHGFTLESAVVLDTDGGERHFHLNVSPLEERGRELGQLVVLRDVTALKEHEADLQLLKQLFGRVLRHNIRNDLNVVRALGKELAGHDDEELSEIGRLVAEKSHGVVELSEKAREIERLVETDRRATTLDLGTTVTELVESYRSIHPDVTFDVVIRQPCVVEVAPALRVAIGNLVQNAAEHNDGPDPHVTVVVDCSEDEAIVRITDDGPGIPPQELEVLERREETQLRHGSGIGLWFVDWAVRESSASIDFETGPDGTTSTVTIPR